jgi:hypothetical protein
MRMIDRSLAIVLAAVVSAMAASACDGGEETTGGGGTGGTGGGGGPGGSGGDAGGTGGQVQVQTVTVAGTVVDFQTGMPVSESATLSTTGLSPAPKVSVTGADFEVEGVAPYSVFYMLAGAPPGHHNTYNGATVVEAVDVSGLKQAVVAEAFLTELATAFGEASGPGKGTIIARAVDESGNPDEGVPASAFTIDGGVPAKTPHFLDAQLAPAPNLTATSASGYVVFYDVPEGLVTVGAADGSGLGISGPQTPSAANVVSLVTLTVTAGGPVLPTNVSFTGDVVPIFKARGCEVCHSGNSPGADLGDLSLNGSDNSIYKDLTQELSKNFGTTRVDLMAPEKSLVLTMPSAENPPDPHPNASFASASDPDYLTLLAWITEGAQQN